MIKNKHKYELDYYNTISRLKNIGISSKRELTPEKISIKTETKIQFLHNI